MQTMGKGAERVENVEVMCWLSRSMQMREKGAAWFKRCSYVLVEQEQVST